MFVLDIISNNLRIVKILSYEHYYICDGNKVAISCIEWEWVQSNRTQEDMLDVVGMRCEEKC